MDGADGGNGRRVRCGRYCGPPLGHRGVSDQPHGCDVHDADVVFVHRDRSECRRTGNSVDAGTNVVGRGSTNKRDGIAGEHDLGTCTGVVDGADGGNGRRVRCGRYCGPPLGHRGVSDQPHGCDVHDADVVFVHRDRSECRRTGNSVSFGTNVVDTERPRFCDSDGSEQHDWTCASVMDRIRRPRDRRLPSLERLRADVDLTRIASVRHRLPAGRSVRVQRMGVRSRW